MTRYEKFNEMIFESYCKKSIENATNKERQRKVAKWKLEQPFDGLTDAVLHALSVEDDRTSPDAEPYQVFKIQGTNIPVYNQKLSRALSYLLPKDREIVLLYFFKGLKDINVASLVHMSRATVSRRRKAAMERLRELMENST